jgi:hypothetical protein
MLAYLMPIKFYETPIEIILNYPTIYQEYSVYSLHP